MITPWTDEVITELGLMWASGKSASVIAGILGFTRNSVIGKIHRLGLGTPIEKIRESRDEQRARRVALGLRIRTHKPKLKLHPEVKIPLNPVTFMQIKPHQCRFIFGEPDGVNTLYCGAVTDKTYCSKHYHIVYMSSPRMTDEERARRAAQWRKIVRAYKADDLIDIGDAA